MTIQLRWVPVMVGVAAAVAFAGACGSDTPTATPPPSQAPATASLPGDPAGATTSDHTAGTVTVTTEPSGVVVTVEDFGEALTPFTVAGDPPMLIEPDVDQDAISGQAARFLELWWQPPAGLTYGGLADAVEPYATARFAEDFRDPRGVDELVGSFTPDDRVVEFTVQVASVEADTAVVAGRAVVADGRGTRISWVTLTMVRDSGGVWRADTFR